MSDFLFEKNGPVVTITINRPDDRNPLGEDGDGDKFVEMAAKINADTTTQVAILTGAGSAFSAGGNLKKMRDSAGPFAGSGVELRERYRNNIHRMVKAVWNIEVPVIAAVNGPAVGLGNDVACLADIRIASDKARFAATFLKIGLVPGDGGAWILSRVIGHSRAAELFYTCEFIDAPTAKDWGLVTRVVPHESLMDEARKVAAQICKQPPAVLRMTKKLIREGMRSDFDTILEMSAAYQALAHHTEDHHEAVKAFFEKRDGVYKGR
jgi:enoyl-CoA hydratase/carnithine racemase